MEHIRNIENCVASLEATQSILSHIYDVEQRTNLTETELALVRLNVAHASGFIGSSVGNISPSLESDNFFEATDVVASMEAIGEAIKNGAKAVWVALVKACTAVATFVKSMWKKIRGQADVVDKQIDGVEKAAKNNYGIKEYKVYIPAIVLNGIDEPPSEPMEFVRVIHKYINEFKATDFDNKHRHRPTATQHDKDATHILTPEQTLKFLRAIRSIYTSLDDGKLEAKLEELKKVGEKEIHEANDFDPSQPNKKHKVKQVEKSVMYMQVEVDHIGRTFKEIPKILGGVKITPIKEGDSSED